MPSLSQTELRRMMKLQRQKKEALGKIETDETTRTNNAIIAHSHNAPLHTRDETTVQPIRGILKKPKKSTIDVEKANPPSTLNDLMAGYSDSDESDNDSIAKDDRTLNVSISHTGSSGEKSDIATINSSKQTKIRFSDDTKDINSVSKRKKIKRTTPTNNTQSIDDDMLQSTTHFSKIETTTMKDDKSPAMGKDDEGTNEDMDKELLEDFLDSIDDDEAGTKAVEHEIDELKQERNESTSMIPNDTTVNLTASMSGASSDISPAQEKSTSTSRPKKKKKLKSSKMESSIDKEVINEAEQTSYEARLAKLILLRSRKRSEQQQQRGEIESETSIERSSQMNIASVAATPIDFSPTLAFVDDSKSNEEYQETMDKSQNDADFGKNPLAHSPNKSTKSTSLSIRAILKRKRAKTKMQNDIAEDDSYWS